MIAFLFFDRLTSSISSFRLVMTGVIVTMLRKIENSSPASSYSIIPPGSLYLVCDMTADAC